MRKHSRRGRKAQKGSAILLAMLIVVMVATLSSAMVWKQYRSVEVETAQRSRTQSKWVLLGATDWARAILAQSTDSATGVNLGQAWAMPLQPSSLATYLSSDTGTSLVADKRLVERDAYLSGAIQDLQSRLNLNNLVQNGKVHPATRATWDRLFKALNLPQSELDKLAEQLLKAKLAASGLTAANGPLVPQAVENLTWLGVKQQTIDKLKPYITILPGSTPVNLNTASAIVLAACLPGMDLNQAKQLVQERISKPMASEMDALLLIRNAAIILDPAEHSVTSSYFKATGELISSGQTVQMQSILMKTNNKVSVTSVQHSGGLSP